MTLYIRHPAYSRPCILDKAGNSLESHRTVK